MPSDPIDVTKTFFLGRVEEQKQFRAALNEVLAAPPEEDLPYVVLLYGDGGMGKTMLARRFREIAQMEQPFAGEFQILWIDWKEERRRWAALQVGREHISPEAVFDILYANAVNAKWGGCFGAYQGAVKKRGEAEKKALGVLSSRGERGDLAALRGAGTSAILNAVRAGLRVEGAGEQVAKAFLNAGIMVSTGQAAQLRPALEACLRSRLDAEQYELFVNPHQQLARALADGLRKIGGTKPALVFLDSYELVERADPWLRQVMLAAGPRVGWVLSGRNNLDQSRPSSGEYFKGYAAIFPRRLLLYKLRQLAEQELRTLLADRAPDRAVDEEAVQAISRCTLGVPLALAEAADLWAGGVALADIVGNIDNTTPPGQIAYKMTTRYFLHAVAEADKPALFALALAEGDFEVLRAMLRPVDATPFDLEALLKRLERDYPAIHHDYARLHEEPAHFLRTYFKDRIHHAEDFVKTFNQRAAETLRVRLRKIQASLPRLEDRCQDNEWTKTVLARTEYLFWQDENEAWHWLVPRLVEGLVYSCELQGGLFQIGRGWEDYLSKEGKTRLKGLRAAQNRLSSPDERAELLEELTRLESLGWLKGEGETERGAILDWQRGKLLYERGKYADALARFERAERGLPDNGGALKVQLGTALVEFAGRLIWPQGGSDAVYSPDAERILTKVVAWLPDSQEAWCQLGVILSQDGKFQGALAAFQRAVELDSNYANPLTGLGSAYVALGQYDDAIAAYQVAIEIDPKAAAPHSGLGSAWVALGQYDDALAAYQHAIELNPKDSAPYKYIGEIYAQQGKVEDALSAYQHAIVLDPKDASPHSGLGNLYRKLGKSGDALAAYHRAIKLNPKDAVPHNGLGNLYSQLGKLDDAFAAYQRATELDPKFAAPHNSLGNVQVASGKYDEALAAYLRAIELDPQAASPHNGLGNVYRKLGMIEAALASYQRAITLDPKDASPHNGLGNAYAASGRVDDALAAYQHAIDLDPKYATPYNNIAEIYLQQGKLDEAQRALTEYIRLRKEDIFAPSVSLGMIARHQGLPESDVYFTHALAKWETAWRARRQTPAVLLKNKAAALLCLGKKEEALQALRQAIGQMLPGDTIELESYSLLQSAPIPPDGLEEMIALLKEVQVKRK